MQTKLRIPKSAARKLATQYAKGLPGIMYAEQNGRLCWSTDSFSAIKTIIEPNTPRAKICDSNPKMDSILDGIKPDTLISGQSPSTSAQGEDEPDYCKLESAAHNGVKVNRKYLANLEAALPHAKIYADFSRAYNPLMFVQNGEIVGLLMPVREG